MKRFYISWCTVLFSTILTGQNPAGDPENSSGKQTVSLSSNGWTITANSQKAVIEIGHEDLGQLLNEVKINSGSSRGPVPLKNWTVSKKNENQLIIQTSEPSSAWNITLSQNNLIISCTSVEMFLTAKVPSPGERPVARLIDRNGVPVNWTGTNEITTWKGNETSHTSYLPSKNPEVMTFALGNVSALNLHSLFDRRKDIAVSFSDLAIMKRSQHNDGILDITIPVPGNTIIKLTPGYFTKTLGLPFYSSFNDSVFRSAPVIWGSWTAYYNQARESDIIANADWISQNLKSYGFQYVQLDDGYDRGLNPDGHEWIGKWDKELFPHGPEWLASYIKSKGLKPGLWLVPNSYAGAFKEHPEWYLYDKTGKPIIDYQTPALDYTNPAVQDWLKKLFSTLTGWGFEYFKFDGEMALPAYSPMVDKDRLYDKSIDPIAAYRNRLSLIRNVIGPETFIEGCVAGAPLDGIGFMNSFFNGADVYNSWKGSYALFSSINANAFWNHIVAYVMPGEGIDVSPLMSVEDATSKMVPRAVAVARSREDPFTGFGTTIAEARTLVSFVSLTGVAYPLSSVMHRLPEERTNLLKMTMPTVPILPVDLFSRGTDITWSTFRSITPDNYIHNYPEILDLKVNAPSGTYDVVGFINWRSERASKNISLSGKLGLEPGISYVIFDFWNQKLLGVYNENIQIDIEPHDTRVLLIHATQDNPQLLGISRHISGAYSIRNLKWDNSLNSLTGTSETIGDDEYSLFIHVPKGIKISSAEATTGRNSKVKVKYELVNNLLRVDIPGQAGDVKWQVTFKNP